MNREEANKEAKKIFEDWQNEKKKIENEAKRKGIWSNVGLDSNNHLFKEIDEEVKRKLDSLKLKVTEK